VVDTSRDGHSIVNDALQAETAGKDISPIKLEALLHLSREVHNHTNTNHIHEASLSQMKLTHRQTVLKTGFSTSIKAENPDGT